MTTRRARKPKPAKEATFESLFGVRFKRPELLALALTHSSFANEKRSERSAEPHTDRHSAPPSPYSDLPNEPGTDNEQMEFLGDAVLGLIVTEVLYSEFPECDEGVLTRLRASLVGRPHLAAVAVSMDLGAHLRMGRSAELNGAGSKPAVLADAMEALIAAVYLDSGLAAARKFVERFVIAPQRDTLHAAIAQSEHGAALRDAKSQLQERVQASGAGRLHYIDTERSGPAHQLRFTVEARIEQGETSLLLSSAEGLSKKEAQQLAAQNALDNWQPLSLPEAREGEA